MLTFHVEDSIFPHVQVTSWCQRQWHVLHMSTVRIQIGTTVIQKEITLMVRKGGSLNLFELF